MSENFKKSISTSFQLWAAPERWLKCTILHQGRSIQLSLLSLNVMHNCQLLLNSSSPEPFKCMGSPSKRFTKWVPSIKWTCAEGWVELSEGDFQTKRVCCCSSNLKFRKKIDLTFYVSNLLFKLVIYQRLELVNEMLLCSTLKCWIWFKMLIEHYFSSHCCHLTVLLLSKNTF